MRLFSRRTATELDRRQALSGVPTINPGVRVESLAGDLRRMHVTLRRGRGFLEWLRPQESERAYELDAFGSFVVDQIDGRRTVIEIIDAFEKRFPMSRREVELAVVAFVKMLMQRHALTVVLNETAATPTGRPLPRRDRKAETVGRSGALAVLLAAGLWLLGAAHAAAGEGTDEPTATLRAVQALCAESRLPGAAGNRVLEETVRERFAASGFENGVIAFEAPLYAPGHLTLDLEPGGRVELESMHPSLLRPGNFPDAEFQTRLVYLGGSEPEALQLGEGIDLDGAIAVMEYDCGDEWLSLYRFGLAGYIFLGDESRAGDMPYRQAQAKVFNTEISVPRFFADGEQAARLRSLLQGRGAVNAHAVDTPSTWKRGALHDFWAMIPGTDEELSSQVMLITAPVDANAVVPARSTGAQRAVNLHLLLKLLEDFKANPPKNSVMLAAVNGHTQQFAGERLLAWHLMAKREDIEETRQEMARIMRKAWLHVQEYGKLKLEPVAEADRADLHVMMEIFWKLNEAFPDGIDLETVTAEQVSAAIDAARKSVIAGYEGYFVAMGREESELEAEKKEDLDFFAALEALPFETFLAKARRLISVFRDERLFERWRTELDESTGYRIALKKELQDEFKSRLNQATQEKLIVNTKRPDLSEEERKALDAALDAKRSDLRKLLVLFNKLDIGVGRSRTYYRQIAINDRQRETLRAVTDQFIAKFQRWGERMEATLARDAASGAIRDGLGARQVRTAISLELDAHAERFGLCRIQFGKTAPHLTEFGNFCLQIARDQNAPPEDAPTSDAEAETVSPAPYVDAISSAVELHPSYFFTTPVSAAEHLQAAANTTSFALKSAFATHGRLFGPWDTPDALDADRLHALQSWVRRYIAAMAAHPKLLSKQSLKAEEKHRAWSTYIRTYAMEQFTGSPIPTREVPDSLVAIYQRVLNGETPIPIIYAGDVVNCYSGITNEIGGVHFFGIARTRKMCPLAYQMDESFRAVTYAVDKGRIQSSQQIDGNLTATPRATLPLFEAREFVIRDRIDPSLLGSTPLTQYYYWPKDANGRSNPEKFGMHGIGGSTTPALTYASTGPAGIYLYRKRPELEQDRLMVITRARRTVLGSTEEEPEGAGYADPEDFPDDFFQAAAQDLAALNRHRNQGMKGVVNQLLDEFLAESQTANAKAELLRQENRHEAFVTKNAEALGVGIKAYGQIASMKEDMLKAIIAYMALMLPFCFFLQKLLFNFKKLEHELAGFSTIFVSMYVVFRLIHPAFRIAMSPEAIFIAFVLGAIGVFTSLVLHMRFSEEMKMLFQGLGGIGEEVKYGTVGQTAAMIGVQNMRRRRIRTTLTTATIVMVVFTMLAFSSVSRTASPTLINKGDVAPYNGVFYHWPNGLPMDEASYRVLRTIYRGRATLNARRILKNGHVASRSEAPCRLSRPDAAATGGERFIDLHSVTGLPPGDVTLRESLALVEGRMFSGPMASEIILPTAAADALGLSAADVGTARLRLLGREWRLVGLVNDQRYRLARDLNPDLALLPLGSVPKAEQGTRDDSESLEIDIPDLDAALVDPAEIAIIPEAMAAELGGEVTSVSVVFPDSISSTALAEEIRKLLAICTTRFYISSRTGFKLDAEASAEIKPGVYYIGSSYRTSIGGLSKLIIPLIIAGSIILNTMLGTVYERRTEISVFNAIGLNPTHIFIFFLAEAFVYSLLGAVGGYLIGQTIAIVVKETGLVSGVNINFSSLIVVYAILFTMALVILSTIYPGYVATRTAVPSGKRKWSMPDHAAGRMQLVFPFIYRTRLTRGAMAYLHSFFAGLGDSSMGDIVASLDEVTQAVDDNNRLLLTLRYHVSLAPYDLGVTQAVTFTMRYDEKVESYRIHMETARISGEETNWVTTNKPFLERVRKYLIRWRNIDPTRQKWFIEQADALFTGDANVVH